MQQQAYSNQTDRGPPLLFTSLKIGHKTGTLRLKVYVILYV